MTLGRALRVALWAGLAALAATPGYAFPEGAPWNAAGAPGQDNCTTCHFSAEPVQRSPALSLIGVDDLKPGARHRLTVRLEAAAPRRGFLLVARTANGRPAGRFEALDARVETGEGAVRSTLEGSTIDGAAAEWPVVWRAPEKAGKVTFYLAAMAGNDDASPLGDIVHLRQVEVCPGC